MAGNIRGITVEIGGDTTKLGKALETSEKQSKALQKELKNVDRALKFNPANVELLTQKQKILTDQIDATSDKLDKLRAAESSMAAQLKSGKIGEDQYRDFQREIVETESKLRHYASELDATGRKKTALEELTDTMSEQEQEVERLKDEYKNAVLMYGKNSDEAKKLARQIDTLSGDLKENKDKMHELDDAADKLDNSLEETGDSARQASEGFTVMKGVLADLAARAIERTVEGVITLGKKTIETGMSFESSMSQVAAVSGATGSDLEALTEKAEEMGSKTKFSATESAEALNYMAMAGWKTEDMLNGIEGVMSLAAASGADLASTSDIVTDALTAMGYSAGDAGRLADVMAAASSNANTNVGLMGQTFQYAAPIVGALGYSMEDTATAIGLMANAGIKGQKAGTALRSILTRLSAPPKECADAMAALDLELTNSDGTMKTLGEVMDDLRASFADMSETEQTSTAKHIAGQEAMSGLLAIVNAAPEDYEKLKKAIEQSDGAAADMAATMTDNVGGALTLLKSNVESKMIKTFNSAKGSIKKSVQSMNASLDTLDWDKVGESVGKLSEKTADFFNYVLKHSDQVQSLLKATGATITGVFAVNTASKFVNSLIDVKNGVTALWGVMAANPVTIVAAGLGAAAIALTALKENAEEAIEAEYGLTDAEKQSINASKDLKASYDELDKARKDAVGGVNAEYGHLEDLKDEYNSLLDANGDVKEGYEDRANFILTTLAEALGVERDEILKNVDANGRLGQSIDQLIVKKKAEATLAAMESAYTEAVRERSKALETYMSAQQTYESAEKRYRDSVAESGDVLAEYNRLLEEAPASADKYYWAHQEVIKGQQAAKDAMNEAKEALGDAEAAYVGYNSTIQNYEGLSSAVISGDTEKIGQALDNLQSNFITAETGTRDSLQRQLDNYRSNYKLMKQAVEQGMPGVTQAQVDAAKDLVDKAEAELNKLPPEAAESGREAGLDHAEGMASTAGDNKSAAQTVAGQTDEGLKTGDAKGAGAKKGSDYAAGVSGTAGAGKKAGQSVAGQTAAGMGTADAQGVGARKGNEYAAGVKGTQGAASSAGRTIADASKKGAAGVNASETGKTLGSQYAKGVSSKQGEASTSGKNLAGKAKSGAGSVSANGSGQNFGQGFVNGIGSRLAAAFNKAKELAKRALAGLRAGQQEGSPSKLTRRSGGFFGEGYILGIQERTKEAIKAARELAARTVKALGEPDTSNALKLDGTAIDGSSFGRRLDNTFVAKSDGPDFGALIDRLDNLEKAVLNHKSVIKLDNGVLVGETIGQIDTGLAGVYSLKRRGN